MPIFPGCENQSNNAARKKCMSEKVDKFVKRKFDQDLGGELGLSGIQRIYVAFKIDKSGNFTGSNIISKELESTKLILHFRCTNNTFADFGNREGNIEKHRNLTLKVTLYYLQ